MNNKVCACKIGFASDSELPDGADFLMRQAVKNAFYKLTGKDCDFCFSGWGGTLTKVEAEVVAEQDLISRSV